MSQEVRRTFSPFMNILVREELHGDNSDISSLQNPIMADEVNPMKDYLFPILLSALVVPGAGQIYNKEKGKGVVLMALFFLVIFGFMMTLSVSLAALLPPDMTVSPEQVRGLVEGIMEEKSEFITTFWYLTLAIWGYGVLDAYLGARDRVKARSIKSSPQP